MGRSSSSSSSSSIRGNTAGGAGAGGLGANANHMVVRVPPFFIPDIHNSLLHPGSMPAGAAVTVTELNLTPTFLSYPTEN